MPCRSSKGLVDSRIRLIGAYQCGLILNIVTVT
jgi:hypothetical protein